MKCLISFSAALRPPPTPKKRDQSVYHVDVNRMNISRLPKLALQINRPEKKKGHRPPKQKIERNGSSEWKWVTQVRTDSPKPTMFMMMIINYSSWWYMRRQYYKKVLKVSHTVPAGSVYEKEVIDKSYVKSTDFAVYALLTVMWELDSEYAAEQLITKPDNIIRRFTAPNTEARHSIRRFWAMSMESISSLKCIFSSCLKMRARLITKGTNA